MNLEQLKNLVKENEFEVEFIKQDGSLRKMKCKLLGEKKPGLLLVEEIGVGFRSFYLDSIKAIKNG